MLLGEFLKFPLSKSIKILTIFDKTVLHAEYYKLFISQVKFNFFLLYIWHTGYRKINID